MLKKILAVILLLVMTLCLTACPSGTGLMPAEEIIEKAVQAMEDVRTYRFEMDMSMDMELEYEGEAYEETMTMELSGALDLENQEMMMDMLMSMMVFGEDEEMSGEIYLIDDMMYVMAKYTDSDPMWVKVAMPEDYWEQMNQIEPQVELLEAVQVEVTGSENIRGVDCYALTLAPDIEQLWQLAMQQSGMAGEEMLPEMDLELYRDIFKDFSMKQWIAKDTYFLAKAEMSIEIEATPEDMGYPEEEGMMTMGITMDFLAYDYNQPVSIVLPEGAEDAIEEYEYEPQGIVDEANYEADDVEIAVLAAIVVDGIYELTAGGTVGPGYASSVYAADGVTELDIVPYLYSYLEATYVIAEDGHIISAVAEPGGSWDGLTYTEYYGWME
jgi:hypothetical protein